MDDFPDDGIQDEAASYAAKMTRASITDQTRSGHVRWIKFLHLTLKCWYLSELSTELSTNNSRIIQAYITFHLRRDSNWNAKQVNEQTPSHITAFITQKCGPVTEGFEGRKVICSSVFLYLYRALTSQFLVCNRCLNTCSTYHVVSVNSSSRECFWMGPRLGN